MSAAHVANALDIPRSTIVRLIDGLADIDLLTIQGNGTADLSARWLALADAASVARSEWGQARQAMRDLAESTSCTVTLSVYHDGAVVCLDWLPGLASEVLHLMPGRTSPLHAGAEGRVVLGSLPESELGKILAKAPFEGFTPRTMITAEELLGDVARSRRQGYTMSLEDAWVGVGAIAVPVWDADGHPGSIALSSTSDEILGHAQEWTEAILEVGERATA